MQVVVIMYHLGNNKRIYTCSVQLQFLKNYFWFKVGWICKYGTDRCRELTVYRGETRIRDRWASFLKNKKGDEEGAPLPTAQSRECTLKCQSRTGFHSISIPFHSLKTAALEDVANHVILQTRIPLAPGPPFSGFAASRDGCTEFTATTPYFF